MIFILIKKKIEVSGHTEYIVLLSISPVTDLEWPREFQEVKAPRFRDNGTGWW
jgi:hypothetical protein